MVKFWFVVPPLVMMTLGEEGEADRAVAVCVGSRCGVGSGRNQKRVDTVLVSRAGISIA